MTEGILGFALLFTALAALFDLRTGHIPNRLTLGALALGTVLQMAALCWFSRPPAQPLTLSLVALAAARVGFAVVICALVPYLLFLRNGMGGGDVKLLGALGATLGPAIGLEVQLYAFLGMLLFALARFAYLGRLTQLFGNALALLRNPLLPSERRREPSPELTATLKFAPAVFAATVFVSVQHFLDGRGA
jgi:prepilin peptidase CpaA